jgi:hypothetical protein
MVHDLGLEHGTVVQRSHGDLYQAQHKQVRGGEPTAEQLRTNICIYTLSSACVEQLRAHTRQKAQCFGAAHAWIIYMA